MTTTYAGPERREQPREVSQDAPVTTRIITKLDTMSRIIRGGFLDRELKYVPPHDGTGA